MNSLRQPVRLPETCKFEQVCKPGSVVWTAIYLGVTVTIRSSHLLGTTGPVKCPTHGVAPDRVYSGRLLPTELVSSYLTFPPLPRKARQSISVALFRQLPAADVIRYPCPVEPGLSSQNGLSAPVCAAVRPARLFILTYRGRFVKCLLTISKRVLAEAYLMPSRFL